MEIPRQRRLEAGFNLLEMMAVVLIIGLLATLVGTAVFQQIDKARVTTGRTQIKMLESAVGFYQMDNGVFPSADQGLEALVSEPSSDPVPRSWRIGGYLQGGAVPTDPWGNRYEYRNPGEVNEGYLDIWSWGSDGIAGGEGTGADFGNWATTNEG